MSGKVNRNISSYFENYGNLIFDLPFEDFDEANYNPPKENKVQRIFKYGIDMLLSLLRR